MVNTPFSQVFDACDRFLTDISREVVCYSHSNVVVLQYVYVLFFCVFFHLQTARLVERLPTAVNGLHHDTEA